MKKKISISFSSFLLICFLPFTASAEGITEKNTLSNSHLFGDNDSNKTTKMNSWSELNNIEAREVLTKSTDIASNYLEDDEKFTLLKLYSDLAFNLDPEVLNVNGNSSPKIYKESINLSFKDFNHSSNSLPLLELNNSSDYSKDFRIAQSTSTQPKSQPIGFSQRDFETPDSPASRLIGSASKSIPNISTPGALAFNLLNGTNSDGKFATGIAIDTIPYLLFKNSGMTVEEYQKNWFLANTSLSIATTAAGNGDASRLGLGVQLVLKNDGDKRTNDGYLQQFEKFALSITKDPNIGLLPPDEQKKTIQERIKKFKDSVEYKNEIKRLEREPIWTVAAGTSFLAPTGRYSDLRGDGSGFWTTYKSGISDNTQVIIHASYRSGERLTNLNNTNFNGDTLTLGTRFRFSDSTDSIYSLEAAYNVETKQGASSNNYVSIGVGLDQKIFEKENVWLSLFFRSDPGRENGSDFRFNSGLKWEFGSSGNF